MRRDAPQLPASTPTLAVVQPHQFSAYRLLGAPIKQRGTNGWWTPQVFANAFHCALSLHNFVFGVGVPLDACLRRVADVGVVLLGDWYARYNGLDVYVVYAALAGFPLEVLNPECPLRALPNGHYMVRFAGGDWEPLTRELIDACHTEMLMADSAGVSPPDWARRIPTLEKRLNEFIVDVTPALYQRLGRITGKVTDDKYKK